MQFVTYLIIPYLPYSPPRGSNIVWSNLPYSPTRGSNLTRSNLPYSPLEVVILFNQIYLTHSPRVSKLVQTNLPYCSVKFTLLTPLKVVN